MYTNTNSRGGIVSLPLTDHRHNARVGLNNARISFNTLKLIVPYYRNHPFHTDGTERFNKLKPCIALLAKVTGKHLIPFSGLLVHFYNLSRSFLYIPAIYLPDYSSRQ